MNKNILLTGCSKGVGLMLLKLLLKNEYNVYGISRTMTDELSDVLRTYPSRFNYLQFDLAEIDHIKQKVFKDFVSNRVELSGFVNNAAIAYDDIVTNLNQDSLQKMFQVNVYAPFHLTKYVIRNMLLHKSKGSIVHLSSISVHTAYKGLAMYAATKGALEAFSKGTAREWGERGIRSNCIVAGFMETEMSNSLTSEQKLRIYNRTSLKSATNIESVASTIMFLLSDNARSITGQNIHVDSGTI